MQPTLLESMFLRNRIQNVAFKKALKNLSALLKDLRILLSLILSEPDLQRRVAYKSKITINSPER